MVRNKVLKISFIISIFLHLMIFGVGKFRLIEGEINPEDYKLVQLTEIVAETEANKSEEGEIIPTKTKSIIAEFPKEDQIFSTYLPFFQVAKLPSFITMVKPVYPALAKSKGIEAEVLAEVYIDAEGTVRRVVILRSGGEEFDIAVIEAIYKSKFSPAVSKEGSPTPVRVRIPYKFISE